VARLANNEVARGEINPAAGVNQGIEVFEAGQRPAQVRNLQEAKPRGGMPDPCGYVLRLAAPLNGTRGVSSNSTVSVTTRSCSEPMCWT